MKSPIHLKMIVLFLTLLALPAVSRAELKTFTVDQSQSKIFISGSLTFILTFQFTPQGSGSLTTAYTGTIETDITGDTITFVGGSVVEALDNGTWQPGPGGVAGSAPASYGGQITSVGALAAVRNVLFDMTSSGTTITGVTFPATSVTFNFPPWANTVIDYTYTAAGGGSGSQSLAGTSYANAINTNATLVTSGAELVLTIPVDISGTADALGTDDLFYRLRGKFVAKAPAPVVSIPLQITAFSVTNTQVTMSIDTTVGQHFTILGSTNFSNWTTNDSFTASATNTTRAFAVPAAAIRPSQYFRVRQD